MNVEEATLVWEAVGAMGSIAGAAVSAGAAVFAVRLAQQERRDRLDERDDRIAAQNRLRDAQEEAIRSQARRVVFQVISGQPGKHPRDHTWMSGEEGDVPVTCWRVSVRNATSDPVRDVMVWISPEGHPTLVDTARFDVIGPDEVMRAERGARTEIIQARAEYRAQFTDAAGRRWEVRQDGDLRQV